MTISMNQLDPILFEHSGRYQQYCRRYPKFVTKAREAEASLKARIIRLESLSFRRKRSSVRKILMSDTARLASVWRAVIKKRRYDLSPDEIIALVTNIDVFKPCDERVEIKSTRHWRKRARLVRNYGVLNRARQQLVRQVLGGCHRSHNNQYFYDGVPAALEAMEEAIRSGKLYGAELDVIGFYPSLTKLDGLQELLKPIPKRVVQHTISCLSDNVLIGNRSGGFVRPPSGDQTVIAHGSATSDIVGEIIMANIMGSVPDVTIIGYHDNMFVFGRTQRELLASVDAVREAVAKQLVGSLEVSLKQEWHYPEIFTFLGSEVEPTDGPWEWRLSQQVRSEYAAILDERELGHDDEVVGRRQKSFNVELLHKLYRGLPKLVRRYDRWQQADEWRNFTSMQILARLIMAQPDERLYRTRLIEHYRWLSQNGIELTHPHLVFPILWLNSNGAGLRDVMEELYLAWYQWLNVYEEADDDQVLLD